MEPVDSGCKHFQSFLHCHGLGDHRSVSWSWASTQTFVIVRDKGFIITNQQNKNRSSINLFFFTMIQSTPFCNCYTGEMRRERMRHSLAF